MSRKQEQESCTVSDRIGILREDRRHFSTVSPAHYAYTLNFYEYVEQSVYLSWNFRLQAFVFRCNYKCRPRVTYAPSRFGVPVAALTKELAQMWVCFVIGQLHSIIIFISVVCVLAPFWIFCGNVFKSLAASPPPPPQVWNWIDIVDHISRTETFQVHTVN